MPVKTRGSEALDKAQRRLALLKSIDENLDLGHGLTVPAYSELIAEARAALESYNTLLSEVEESRKAVIQIDKALAERSARMLSGVATRFGRSSIEYIKAGGSPVARRTKSSRQTPAQAPAIQAAPATESVLMEES